MSEARRFLTIEDVAELRGVKPSTVREWCRRGEGPPFTGRGETRAVSREGYERWVRELEARQAERAARTRSRHQAVDRLADRLASEVREQFAVLTPRPHESSGRSD